jgi:hypothetical protein
MADDKTYLIEVRLRVREVQASELQPGDRVWYFIRKYAARKKLSGPDPYGPFTVVTTDPFVIRNSGGVALPLPPENLILLVPTGTSPEII